MAIRRRHPMPEHHGHSVTTQVPRRVAITGFAPGPLAPPAPDRSRIGHRISGRARHPGGRLRTRDPHLPCSGLVSGDGAGSSDTPSVLLGSVLGVTSLGGSNPPPSAAETPADQRERPDRNDRGVRLSGAESVLVDTGGYRRKSQGTAGRGATPGLRSPVSPQPCGTSVPLSPVR